MILVMKCDSGSGVAVGIGVLVGRGVMEGRRVGVGTGVSVGSNGPKAVGDFFPWAVTTSVGSGMADTSSPAVHPVLCTIKSEDINIKKIDKTFFFIRFCHYTGKRVNIPPDAEIRGLTFM